MIHANCKKKQSLRGSQVYKEGHLCIRLESRLKTTLLTESGRIMLDEKEGDQTTK